MEITNVPTAFIAILPSSVGNDKNHRIQTFQSKAIENKKRNYMLAIESETTQSTGSTLDTQSHANHYALGMFEYIHLHNEEY